MLTFSLSTHMRESCRFWLNYAAKNSWAFDTILRKHLDGRIFGIRKKDVPKENLWKTRVYLLSEKERAAIEPFVKWIMEDQKERMLVNWNPEEVKRLLTFY